MSSKEEFCLFVLSDMHPGRDTFETESDPIPKNRVLHLQSQVVTCDPKEWNTLQSELLWREEVNGEAVDHPFDIPVWTQFSEARSYPEQAKCLDGTPLVGNGNSKLVIRRHIEGSVEGPQTAAVVVRGYYH